jgi:methylated-DNA-[protein]-cysteine S-methyltransferase
MRSVVKDLPANLHGSMMSAVGFTLFETAIGHCGVAWSDRGIVGVQLPESGIRRRRRACSAAFRLRAVSATARGRPRDAIVALQPGAKADLSAIAPTWSRCRLSSPRLRAARHSARRHADLAISPQCSRPGAARRRPGARAQPFAIVVPCHQVLAAGGKMGGFSANGGVSTSSVCSRSRRRNASANAVVRRFCGGAETRRRD